MTKEFLIDCLSKGMSTRDIEKAVGKDHRTISYWIKKYGLSELSKYKKNPKFQFGKIDSIEKAYTLGFMLCDAAISHNTVEVTTSKRDNQIIEFIAKVICGNVHTDDTFNKKSRQYPHSTCVKKISDITKFTGGEKKVDRHYPRVRSDLERYLIQGAFDADGCLTWGRRKDKNRIWQKICFTSQLKILEGIQQYLLKNLGITSVIRPKTGENCYVLEFSNRCDVIKFCEHIYQNTDFIVLLRKYFKYKALRLELEENGEGTKK